MGTEEVGVDCIGIWSYVDCGPAESVIPPRLELEERG